MDIKIPSLGESIQKVCVARILKTSGCRVAQDEEIVEVETEKLNQVIYAPAPGILSLSIREGQELPIGALIGEVDLEGKAQTAPQPTPVAQEPPRERRTKMSSLRKTIAERLVATKNESATLTTFNEVDMTCVMETRQRTKEAFLQKFGVKLGMTSFFARAMSDALKTFPEVRATIDGDDIVERNYIDIGVALASKRGLIVPVLRDVDRLDFAAIERGIDDFVARAETGRLEMKDLAGGVATITNGGVFGSLMSTPLLPPKQTVVLGMHTIQWRPVCVKETVCSRPMMYLALSYDHRLIDGKEAISFLAHIKNYLETPSNMNVGL